jgi:hypothetical protein
MSYRMIKTNCILDNLKHTYSSSPQTIKLVNGELVMVSINNVNPCCVCSNKTESHIQPCNHALCKDCGDKLCAGDKKEHKYDTLVHDNILYKNLTILGYDCPKCSVLITERNIIL